MTISGFCFRSNERITERGDQKKKRMAKEEQLRNIVTTRIAGVFENVTEGTFGGFTNGVFEGFENVTSDIIGDNHATDVTNTVENFNFMDTVNTTNIGLLVEVMNGSLAEIENATHMENLAAPAPEFM